MALDVLIGHRKEEGSRHFVSFDPEVLYWFMWPWIETLSTDHNKYLDLYDDCEFAPGEIPIFYDFLSKVEEAARREPEEVQVCMGFQTHPARRLVYQTVERQALLEFIQKLREAAETCVREQRPLYFFGD